MKKDLCIICPTRYRPQVLLKMINSLINTQSKEVIKHIVVATDSDDKNQGLYQNIISDNISNKIFERKNITYYINEIYKDNINKYHNFMVINDDFEFKTKNWDLILTQKAQEGRVAFPRDGNQDGIVPTTFCIPSFILEVTGWLQLPTLTHLYGDMVWQAIMKKCNISGYCKDVLIEHNHFLYRKSDEDEIYQYTNSKEMYSRDQEAFRYWLNHEAYEDCERIQKAIERFKNG